MALRVALAVDDQADNVQVDTGVQTTAIVAAPFTMRALTDRTGSMQLTPEDVHNVAFNKPPIGRRGYNEDEVDDFLDIVDEHRLDQRRPRVGHGHARLWPASARRISHQSEDWLP